MRHLVAVTLILCGTGLLALPAIYAMVSAANRNLALAHKPDIPEFLLPPLALDGGVAAPTFVAGATMVAFGALVPLVTALMFRAQARSGNSPNPV